MWLVLPSDGNWGSPMPNGTFNGMVGMVQRQVVDFAIASFTITYIRDTVIDFTHAFYEEPTTILIPPPSEQNNFLAFLEPFSWQVWALTLASILVVGPLLWVLANVGNLPVLYPHNIRNVSYSLSRYVWDCAFALASQSTRMRQTEPVRVLHGMWWTFCVILIYTYTGTLIAFLTVPRMTSLINSLEELANQRKVLWTYRAKTAHDVLFSRERGVRTALIIVVSSPWAEQNAEASSTYSKIGSLLKERPELIVSTDKEGVDAVLGGRTAFIKEKSWLDFAMEADYKETNDCRLAQVSQVFFSAGFGWVLQEDSLYLQLFNTEILKMSQSGLFSIWKNQYWPKPNKCTAGGTAAASGPKPLQLKNFSGHFFIFGVGLCLAFLAHVGEKVVSRWSSGDDEPVFFHQAGHTLKASVEKHVICNTSHCSTYTDTRKTLTYSIARDEGNGTALYKPGEKRRTREERVPVGSQAPVYYLRVIPVGESEQVLRVRPYHAHAPYTPIFRVEPPTKAPHETRRSIVQARPPIRQISLEDKSNFKRQSSSSNSRGPDDLDLKGESRVTKVDTAPEHLRQWQLYTLVHTTWVGQVCDIALWYSMLHLCSIADSPSNQGTNQGFVMAGTITSLLPGVLTLFLLLTATLARAKLDFKLFQDGFIITVDGTEVEDEVLVKVEVTTFIEATISDFVYIILRSYEDTDLRIGLYVTEDLGDDGCSTVNVLVNVTHTINTYNRMWVRFYADEEERVWGGGEQYTYFNLRGHDFPIWTSEQVIIKVSVDPGTSQVWVGTTGPSPAWLTWTAALAGTTTPPTGLKPRSSPPEDIPFLSPIETKTHPFVSYQTLSLRYLVLNFTEATRHEVYVHDHKFSASMVWCPSLLKTVQTVTTRLGAQPQLPDWIMTGAALGVQRGTEEALAPILAPTRSTDHLIDWSSRHHRTYCVFLPQMLFYYDLAVAAGANVSALWIQDWSGTTETLFGHRVFWDWRWNQTYYPESRPKRYAVEAIWVTKRCHTTHYYCECKVPALSTPLINLTFLPDLDVAIQNLMEEGVRVMAYINPHLVEEGDMFREAAASGYLMTDAEGEVYKQDFGGFLAGTVDLFNPEANNWYRDEIIKNMVELGLGGWMADFGEYTALDMYSATGELYDPETRHNLLPEEWARCTREVLESSGQLGEVVPFMRSGGLGSSGYQVLAWAGDQNVDWSLSDGLATTIVAALSLAVSGMGVTHFDIGGYTTLPPLLTRSKELFLRSCEYAAFTPVMRTHEGNIPEANHQFYSDEDTLTLFARLSQIHATLLPYTRYLLQELSTTGTPVQRPLFLDFEEDIGSWDIEYQYLYGPDLLVAPVIHKGQETQTVYLPGGESGWVYLWEEEEEVLLGPANITVPVSLGYPAVYYREDSLWRPLFQEIVQEFGLAKKARWVSS
ncbi:Sulfoquinovosidase-like [Homarus americanus]|uniref:Sulfoquinovosidase-like n=1 Tax=Homarus americanus TaxID=6706 RepID=A0A8J5K692_HOMAM|nr:Sulfoquinovosidase-like [Homarus americanus]